MPHLPAPDGDLPEEEIIKDGSDESKKEESTSTNPPSLPHPPAPDGNLPEEKIIKDCGNGDESKKEEEEATSNKHKPSRWERAYNYFVQSVFTTQDEAAVDANKDQDKRVINNLHKKILATVQENVAKLTNRREIQQKAKEHRIRANQSTKQIKSQLVDSLVNASLEEARLKLEDAMKKSQQGEEDPEALEEICNQIFVENFFMP